MTLWIISSMNYMHIVSEITAKINIFFFLQTLGLGSAHSSRSRVVGFIQYEYVPNTTFMSLLTFQTKIKERCLKRLSKVGLRYTGIKDSKKQTLIFH